MPFDKTFLIDLTILLSVVAWCDGELDPKESKVILDLQASIKGLTQEEQARIQSYLRQPQSAPDADALFAQCCRSIDSEEKFQFAKGLLVRLIRADGRIAESEDSLMYRVVRHINFDRS